MGDSNLTHTSYLSKVVHILSLMLFQLAANLNVTLCSLLYLPSRIVMILLKPQQEYKSQSVVNAH